MKKAYNPVKSVTPFLLDEKFISLIVGPVGSTKTTAGIIKIAYHAKRMAPCTDGVRRSRAIWVRNTREQLRDTSIPDFLKWFPDGLAGTYAKTEYKFFMKFDDVECEVLFRGLDDANDIRRLLSLQASFAIFDEFREINPEVFDTMQGRLGRYPDKVMVPPKPEWGVDKLGNPIGGCVTDEGKDNRHLWGMTNPPDIDTYWEKFLSDPPKTASIHFQPSGLSPEADWVQFLPEDYYGTLSEGKSEDWVDVYVHAKFGKSLSGQPVFKSFNRDIHVAKSALVHIRSSLNPLVIGMDFGLTPACTITQVDLQGRLLVFADLTSEGMGIQRFCREKLKPLLASRFGGCSVLIVGDPAGNQRSQADETTVYDILKKEGFRAISAKTNDLVPRINAVESMLTRMIDGKAGVVVDPACTNLLAALRGGYRYRIKKDGEMTDSPDKNKHSHIADAFQYNCLHIDNNATGQVPVKRAVPVRKSGYIYS